MCGIVGYIGKEEAASILYGGLARLEYRGYDSAGIATTYNDGIHVVKDKGQLSTLQINAMKIHFRERPG